MEDLLTSVLVRFTERELKHEPVDAGCDVMHLNLQDFIETKQAKECDCVGSMEETACPAPAPLVRC